MNCPKCNAEITGEANCCSNCGQPVRNRVVFVENTPVKPKKKHVGLRIFLGVIISIIGLTFLINGISNMLTTDNTNPSQINADAKASQATTVNSRAVTLEEFNKIQTGMTYSEVCNIIGSDGTLDSQVDLSDCKTEVYHWYGEDGMSNAIITFQNNKVFAKGQTLLK